jgi:uncharacterized protein (TIGR02270 family)
MLTFSRQVVPVVVQQHAEEAAILRNIRSVQVRAPHVKLHHLRRLDDRIAAHLDGLAVAGAFGTELCAAALATPSVGEMFAAGVRAIEDKDTRRLDSLVALAQALPEGERGLLSAFGWVSAPLLQGTIVGLLSAGDPFRRRIAIAACSMHQVDPGAALTAAITDVDPPLRARALRAAGECGRRDLLPVCLSALADEGAACSFWAAWSAVLLGDRGDALRALVDCARLPNSYREPALRLYLMFADAPAAHTLLQSLGRDAAQNMRLLLQGAGIFGDPRYVPWLIKQMEFPDLTRLAGEAFSLITGLDLSFLDLDGKPPEGVDFGPNDDPDDENVAMDQDDSLPWPDVARIQAWWEANQQRFEPGLRYFMGEPLNIASCQSVLREAYQRQRSAAALYLSGLQPARPLFPIAAPAWRQQRWLARRD